MIDEVNYLINQLDISGEHAEEIINIYFECYAGNNWDYHDFLKDEIRIIRETEENQALIAELWTLEDDLCLFEGDNYTMLTNYSTAVKCGDIGDCLPNHSF